jgi:hypothetical protein
MLTVIILANGGNGYLLMNPQPEESISIQHVIGADIIMQLDDVGQCNHFFLFTAFQESS